MTQSFDLRKISPELIGHCHLWQFFDKNPWFALKFQRNSHSHNHRHPTSPNFSLRHKDGRLGDAGFLCKTTHEFIEWADIFILYRKMIPIFMLGDLELTIFVIFGESCHISSYGMQVYTVIFHYRKLWGRPRLAFYRVYGGRVRQR